MSTEMYETETTRFILKIEAERDDARRELEEALRDAGRLRARVEELEGAVRKANADHCGCLGYLAEVEPRSCDCESYEPCAGECCGVGNCTCTPEVLARATAEVTGRG